MIKPYRDVRVIFPVAMAKGITCTHTEHRS